MWLYIHCKLELELQFSRIVCVFWVDQCSSQKVEHAPKKTTNSYKFSKKPQQHLERISPKTLPKNLENKNISTKTPKVSRAKLPAKNRSSAWLESENFRRQEVWHSGGCRWDRPSVLCAIGYMVDPQVFPKLAGFRIFHIFFQPMGSVWFLSNMQKRSMFGLRTFLSHRIPWGPGEFRRVWPGSRAAEPLGPRTPLESPAFLPGRLWPEAHGNWGRWFGTWLLWLSHNIWECHHPNWLSLHHSSEG